ncbi:short-chain dehydrogenase [Streptomyces humidus]|uniref:Short-chain dehydrogenase n=1 Tax=Streptomyces humidus TaxID=52259 RepID=A0A918LDC6_9ACTN|nr:SDR family NAD(P)-dependent oxidoreductase [Streptomyces humidus]GGS31940.1 short-chain dehydrogenase [Streptomyces humidus]
MEQLSFDGDVIAITGAGGGLGRAYAQEFARRGARVVVNDLGAARGGGGASEEPARETVALIREAGGQAVTHFGDISTQDGGADLIDTAVCTYGRLDALVNNAGIAGDIPLLDSTDADFEKYWRVHVMGSVHPIRAAWPHFQAQGRGRIVNTTSGAALYGMSGQSPYASAKGAILGLTKALAVEGEPAGIVVNAVSPAAFTRMQADVVTDEQFLEYSRKSMRSELVAPLVVMLAHRSCSVSGQVFDAFSGRFARVVTGEEAGYFTQDPSAETLRDHWDEVLGTDGGLLVPRQTLEAAPMLLEAAQRTAQ